MSAHPLEKIAAVLEASADYIEELEKTATEQQRVQQEARDAEITTKVAALAERYKRATGDATAAEDVFKKIASSDDDDVKAVFDKLAAFEEADALGTPRRTKTASSNGDIADARFIQWALS